MSGLKINIYKTKLTWIGSKKYSSDKVCFEYNLAWDKINLWLLSIDMLTPGILTHGTRVEHQERVSKDWTDIWLCIKSDEIEHNRPRSQDAVTASLKATDNQITIQSSLTRSWCSIRVPCIRIPGVKLFWNVSESCHFTNWNPGWQCDFRARENVGRILEMLSRKLFFKPVRILSLLKLMAIQITLSKTTVCHSGLQFV